MRNKVYVIGFDGATFDLLGPWIKAGQLPHLKAMTETGVSGELESTVPPVTMPAWLSFATGKNPAKHGSFGFKAQDRNSYRYHFSDPRSRRGPAIWNWVGEAGGRVVVLNLPPTYPPDQVNGVMISGFMTPSGKRDFCYPPELLEQIEQRFGKYPLYPPLPLFAYTQANADIDEFLLACTHALEYKFGVAHYLIDKLDPNLLLLHIHGNDQICHWLWHMLDGTHPRYQPAAAEKYEAKILEYYQRFDAAVGALAERLDENTTLLVISDHGNGAFHQAIDLNVWLLQQGYLVLRKSLPTKARYLLWKAGLTPANLLRKKWIRRGLGKLAKRVMDNEETALYSIKRVSRFAPFRLSYDDIDWSRTRAFCSASFLGGQIKINLKGRWAQGCISAGVEYHTLRDEIAQKLGELRDSHTGRDIEGRVLMSEDIYHGPYFDDAPDISYLPMHRNYLAGSYQFIARNMFFSLWDAIGWTGCHRMEGILIGTGRALRPGTRLTGARIIDLCPTMLYLMGLKIPKEVDGTVLREMFTDTFLEENPVQFIGETGGEEEQPRSMTADEEADLLARLRGLGYVE